MGLYQSRFFYWPWKRMLVIFSINQDIPVPLLCISISACLRRPHWQLSNSPRIARPVLGQNLWLDTTYLGANDLLSPFNG